MASKYETGKFHTVDCLCVYIIYNMILQFCITKEHVLGIEH